MQAPVSMGNPLTGKCKHQSLLKKFRSFRKHTTLMFRPPQGPLISNFMLWVRTATAELLFVTFHCTSGSSHASGSPVGGPREYNSPGYRCPLFSCACPYPNMGCPSSACLQKRGDPNVSKYIATTTSTFRPPQGPLLSNFMFWVRTATALQHMPSKAGQSQ